MLKKNFLFLVNDLSFFISHRLSIAEELKSRGFEVFIGYGELGGANTESLEKKGFKNIYVPMQRGHTNLIQDLKSIYFIWCLFKSIKPNIVHLITIKPYLYGGIVSRFTKVQCVVSAVAGLGTLFVKKNFKNRLLKYFLFFIYRFAFNHPNQYIIVQNNEDAKLLKNWGVAESKKFKLIKGSGVQIKNFINLKEPKGVPAVCFASRLLKDKGLIEYVSAAEIIKKRGIKARFLLAGDLDKKNSSGIDYKYLNKIKKKNYIKFVGFQKNIPKLFSKCHIICLPSYREGLPKVLIEAAAASRAVITTDVPGCKDAIISNQTGILVPVRDSIRLAEAIEYLIKNPNIRNKMGKAGRKLAEKEFLIEKVVKSHIDIFTQLLSRFNKNI